MTAYIGVIHKDEGSEYGVSFPDFPGCVSAGRDMDEAARMAGRALALHVAGMAEDGETLPPASSLDAVREHEFARGATAFIVVDAPVAARRAVKVSITVPRMIWTRSTATPRRTAWPAASSWSRRPRRPCGAESSGISPQTNPRLETDGGFVRLKA